MEKETQQLLDFMQGTLFDGNLRGKFVALLKNPNKEDELIKWLAQEGYTLTIDEIRKLREINEQHEAVRGPGKPLPKY